MTDAETSTGRSTRPTVLIVVRDDDEREQCVSWLTEYSVRTASDGAVAREQIDSSVDVVLLDGGLTDPSSRDLVGAIRARRVGCQIGLLSAATIASDVHALDIDEYVPRPVDRAELVATVDRLVDRRTLVDTVETYLRLVDRKRSLERRLSADERVDEPRYRELTGELVGRRRQIDTILTELADNTDTPTDSDALTTSEVGSGSSLTETSSGSPVGSTSAPGSIGGQQPLYQTRKREFYGLWGMAALTYGLGDIVSTTVAVFGTNSLDEGNPIVDTVLETLGVPGFLVLKLIVFLILLSVSVQGARTHDRFTYYWPPLITTALGLFLTAWNTRLILAL